MNGKGGGRKESLEFLVSQKVDLRGLYGSGGYFGGIALKDKDLRWADLTGASFDGALLDNSNLEGSILVGASFKNAMMSNTNLRGSRLSPYNPTTIFDNANIEGADFRGISFPGVGSDYLMKSFALARGWEKAKFDEAVLKEICRVQPAIQCESLLRR